MTPRHRMWTGLVAGLIAGVLGPSLMAVAYSSGSGNRSILGTVTDAVGPVGGVCVTAWDVEQEYPPVDTSDVNPEFSTLQDSTRTKQDGTYELRRLRPGSYQLRFHECPGPARRVFGYDHYVRTPGEAQGRPVHVAEWWKDQLRREDAQVVVVPPNDDVRDIDAELTRL